MKTNKIIIFLGLIFMISFVFYGVSLIHFTTPEEKNKMTVQQIKICTDSGLEVYQGGDSNWYCKPLNYND